MQVTYQQTFDDWVAAQIFSFEQLSALQKQDKKQLRNLVIFAVGVALVLFFIGEADAFYWFFTAVFAFWIGYLVIKQSASKQRMLYQRLLLAYGPEFEKEEDKTIAWSTGPDAIIVEDRKKEIRYHWQAIRQIVVCPDYLFVKFGGVTGWLSFPGGAVPEPAYQALCEEVIRTYRLHAAKAGKLADVIHSEWAIDLNKLKAASSRNFSLRKTIFTLLWGLALLIIGFLFLSVASFGLGVAAAFVTDYEPEAFGRVFAVVVLAGSFLFWLAGIVLGFLGILPGTKAESTS